LYGGLLSPPSEENERENEPENDEIETDRDSFTPSTNVVGSRRLVVESGYSFVDNRNSAETHSVPELLARYGIGDYCELRFGYNYEVGGEGFPASSNFSGNEVAVSEQVESEAGLSYGTKVRVSKQMNWLPESSIILRGNTPTLGKETATSFSSTYVFGWRLRNDCVWDSAIRYGAESFEGDHFNTWSPSTVLKVPIGERWKAHAEYFGIISEGRKEERSRHFFSPGVHYLFTSNLEVGVRVGWGLDHQSPNFFSNVGAGIRF
jgi:hypothetical protein